MRSNSVIGKFVCNLWNCNGGHDVSLPSARLKSEIHVHFGMICSFIMYRLGDLLYCTVWATCCIGCLARLCKQLDGSLILASCVA
ncbi:unnamed protein product [Urochloa humidicola]